MNYLKIISKHIKENRPVSIILIFGIWLVVAGVFTDDHFASGWWANMLVSGIFYFLCGVSGLVFISIHFLVKAKWSERYIPVAMQFSKLLPFIPFLFIFLFAGYNTFFSHLKSMNDAQFIYHLIWFRMFRTLLIFGILLYLYFIFLAMFKESASEHKKRRISTIFLISFLILFTVFVWDWMMGIVPGWYQSLYAIYQIAGFLSGGLSVIVLMYYFSLKKESTQSKDMANLSYQTGRYLTTMISFWFYLWISQLIITWYAAIPVETSFYRYNDQHTGLVLFMLNPVLNFALPFIFLISKKFKEEYKNLVIVSIVILVGRWLDYSISIIPAVSGSSNCYEFTEAGFLVINAGLFIYLLKKFTSKEQDVIKVKPKFKQTQEKFKIYKYLANLLSGRLVEKIHSNINGDLFVYYVHGKYILNSKHGNYSFGELHQAFFKLFKKINIDQRKIEKVLLLGLGGGSVVSLLTKNFGLKSQITAIEIDQEVIELASKYFEINSYDNLSIVKSDALDFFKINTQKFDLIIFDIYVDSEIPSSFETKNFLLTLKNSLANNGLLIYNKDINMATMSNTLAKFEDSFRQVFNAYRKLQVVKNNYFFLNRDHQT